MAATESTMLELGTPAPNFELPDPDGNLHRLTDFEDAKALVVAFICNHCPFVKHIQDELARFGRDYLDRGVAMVAISANDAESYPADAPARMKEVAERVGYVFPYLYDESQQTAKAYRAACTPEFYLFDGDQKLAYRGRFDGARPGNREAVTGADLRQATDAVLDGRPAQSDQIPSMGCNIKWRRGNEPDY